MTDKIITKAGFNQVVKEYKIHVMIEERLKRDIEMNKYEAAQLVIKLRKNKDAMAYQNFDIQQYLKQG